MPIPRHHCPREQDTETLEDLGLIRDDDDIASNDSGNTPFAEIAEQRLSRRGMLAGLAGVAVLGLVSSPGVSRRALAAGPGASLTFREIPQIYDKNAPRRAGLHRRRYAPLGRSGRSRCPAVRSHEPDRGRPGEAVRL